MRRESTVWIWPLSAALVVALTTGVPAAQSREDLVGRSDVVITGKVVRTGGTTMSGVPASEKLVEVEVTVVLLKPAAVTLIPGERVTVDAKDPSAYREGAEVTIFGQGWILGKRVAIRELGHEVVANSGAASRDAKPGAAKESRKGVAQILARVADTKLQARINEADLVVVGRVVSIGAATLGASKSIGLISEHDPNWQEATIRVDSFIKGAQAGEKIVIRFPASMDVAWHGIPKFKVGQEGTFILKKDQISGSPRALMGATEVDAFTALQQGDVMSTDEANRVSRLSQR